MDQGSDEGDILPVAQTEHELAAGDVGDTFGNKTPGSKQQFARMPVERDALYYNMNHPKRGIAIIFNHEIFEIKSLKPRTGTNNDRDNLAHCLSSLGFDVRVYNDRTVRQLTDLVEEAADENHKQYDCFLMAVLTHGEQGILYAKDAPYKPDKLWQPFSADTCTDLAGKPKLFFIQACQGDQFDGGVTLTTQVDGHPMSYKIPVHADFLIAYSTIPGFFSWRNTTRGSWFIQALCEELKVNVTEWDLLSLLTFVSRRVAVDFESCVPGDPIMNRQKQIPCVTTMLTRLLRFTRK